MILSYLVLPPTDGSHGRFHRKILLLSPGNERRPAIRHCSDGLLECVERPPQDLKANSQPQRDEGEPSGVLPPQFQGGTGVDCWTRTIGRLFVPLEYRTPV